ncbi:MAG TPA: CARDB domain-containing protein, partial [Dehalococcoidia bacterium]|nr:CARDB domain-containing protein [Dehalococcoidia bacterium]
LAVDLLGPSPDGSHNLLLERGTHAPTVYEKTYYLIVIRELEEIPPVPENTVALVAFNITPPGAGFDKDIFLTLGLDELQLPENALNVTMAYYDDVNGVWVFLESEAGGPNGVAELTLSAPINHFSIFGVLAELGSTPTPPAHFIPSGLTIVPSVEKTTFVTKTGESVTITANVANDGWQEGTYTVVLKLNGKTVDTKTVTLDAGQSKQVKFTVSELDYGQYEVEVAGLSGDFMASRTITWWLIIVIIAAIGLIIWGVVWGRRRRKAQQEA